MWQIVNCKNGISSCEVHRAIGITQKSAWFMDHRIRFALGMGPAAKLSGEVEMDETFIGGKRPEHATLQKEPARSTERAATIKRSYSEWWSAAAKSLRCMLTPARRKTFSQSFASASKRAQ